jgi:hypothetical protein
MGRTKKRDMSYFKYQAPIYHREYVEAKESKGKPILRDTEVEPSGYWVDKYHITYHALQRYIERFLGLKDVKVEDLSHKEKTKLLRDLTALLPNNFHKTALAMKIKLSNGCKAVINDKGIVVTVMREK